MATNVEKRAEPAHTRASQYWRGILYGVLPLAAVVVIFGAALLLAALVRQIVGISAFPLQQEIVLIVLGSGVVLTLVAFTIALIFTLRQVAKWQREGPTACAHAALWTLVGSAVVILLPLLLALVWP
jgi:hypothetical protein